MDIVTGRKYRYDFYLIPAFKLKLIISSVSAYIEKEK
jgi:hypothetical protein